MSLIEQALAATGNVVSVRNDVNAINWVAGMSDPGEMVRCGFWQEGRRLAGETDTDYANRLNAMVIPREVLEKVKNAAIKRASLSVANGKVELMVAGNPPWHNLGVNVRQAVESCEAIRLSGLGWTVKKVQNYFQALNGTDYIQADGSFSVLREDNGKRLGGVGSRYEPLQNSEGFAFLDHVIGEFGARYEVAGALYGGSKVFMLVHLPKQAFAVSERDSIEPYCLFTNTHDGTEAVKCYATAFRPVCANTLRQAERGEKGKGMSFRHTGDLKARVMDAKKALGMAVDEFSEFKDKAEVLARTKLEPIPYFDGVLDYLCEVKMADLDKGQSAVVEAVLAQTELDKKSAEVKVQRMIDYRKSMLDEILERYESDTNGVDGIRGTAWSAFNAVTETADHGDMFSYKGQNGQQASRRFESIVNGRADELKQYAFEEVMSHVTINA